MIKPENSEGPSAPDKSEPPRTWAPNEFWERPDIRGARNALDAWASWRWSGILCAQCPKLEAVFEFPAAEFDTGIGAISGVRELVNLCAKNSTDRIQDPVRMTGLAVEVALSHLGATEVVGALLLCLYPRVGPYTRPIYMGDCKSPESAVIRAFRPRQLRQLVGGIQSKALAQRIDSILHSLHREAAQQIAYFAGLPPEVFEREILAIRAPAEAKRPNKKQRAKEELSFRMEIEKFVVDVGLDSNTLRDLLGSR